MTRPRFFGKTLLKQTTLRQAQAVRRNLPKIGVIVLVILAIFALQKYLPVQSWLQSGTSTFRGLGIWGILLFIATYVALVMLFAPGPTLSLTAGALYGVQNGYLIAAIGSLTGATLAFLIARFLFRHKVRQWVSTYAAYKAVEASGRAQPVKTMLSVHLSPLFPFPIANYMLTLTGIRFPLYLFGAWIGMLPGILFYVYVGHLGGNLALDRSHLGARDLWIFGIARVTLWIIGVTSTLSFGMIVKRYSRNPTADIQQDASRLP